MADGITGADAKTAARRLLPLLDLADLDADRRRGGDPPSLRPGADGGRPGRGGLRPAAFRAARPRELLAHSAVRVATVANFPDGVADSEAAARETVEARRPPAPTRSRSCSRTGPGSRRRRRRRGRATWFVGAGTPAADRAAPPPLLKIVLETGRLGDAATIRRAATEAIEAGADVIVTSTGAIEPGTTIAAAATALLDAIAAVADQARLGGAQDRRRRRHAE